MKILFRYGYRLEKKESMTNPLKKIELFKVDIVPNFCNNQNRTLQSNLGFVSVKRLPGPSQSCLHSGLSGESERGGDRLLLSNKEVGGA